MPFDLLELCKSRESETTKEFQYTCGNGSKMKWSFIIIIISDLL
jgi:hypothetical protein